jgi:CheY-like chemotaxis protein
MDSSTAQTVLLVEDDENDVLFMQMAMEHAGIADRLQIVEDGEQAIDYLSGKGDYADRARYPLPVLILLDLKLPRVMGMDVLKWIREKPDFDLTVVIVLTSSQHRTDIQAACSLGANSYLVKPTNPLALKSMMDLVKRYWLTLNHPTSTAATTPPFEKIRSL